MMCYSRIVAMQSSVNSPAPLSIVIGSPVMEFPGNLGIGKVLANLEKMELTIQIE
jgi:hypothetical protein